jgi:hypothetical protein
MEAVRTCECDRADFRDFDDASHCLSCGEIYTSVAPHVSLQIIPSDKRYEPFEYRSLRSGTSFRLIRLLAGRREDDITCQIFHSVISDAPPFEALSYTWGDSSQLHQISSTEGIIHVTANCGAALRDLRYSFRDRILWIDALCINQRNIEEKNIQVPLMNRIYAAARRVVIYIGPDNRQDVSRFLAYFRRSEPSAGVTDRVAQAAVSSFLSKTWFSRVWILQEVAVAKEALLLWGTTTLDWKYFSTTHLHTLSLLPVDHAGKTPPGLLFAEGDAKPLKDLVSLIHTARGCRATEPRDKVYALLGLLDHVQHTLKPDYDKPIEILQSELVMNIINSYNHLDILALTNTETEEEARCARKIAAIIEGMRKGGLLAESRVGDAARKVAHAAKTAEVRIAYLLEAEKNERQTWTQLHYLEITYRQVQEAEYMWQEQCEKHEALKNVHMKLIDWVASIHQQERDWFWRKPQPASELGQVQNTRRMAWVDSIVEEIAIWEKWSESRKARWELAERNTDSAWNQLMSTVKREKKELKTLKTQWHELKEVGKFHGLSVGIDIAKRKYRRKYEIWQKLKITADKELLEIDQEERRRESHVENETAKREAFYDSILALSELSSQGTATRIAIKTAIYDVQRKTEEFARNLLKEKERAHQRLVEERSLWLEISRSNNRDDPKNALLEAEQVWRDAKSKVDGAKNDPLVVQFDEESRNNEMLRLERSDYNPAIKRMISNDLHSTTCFSRGQIRKGSSQHLPSWVPGLEDHQSLASLSGFRRQESEYPEIVAQLCHNAHNHPSPALSIRILELDTIIMDLMPGSEAEEIGDTTLTGFGRAFQPSDTLSDTLLWTEKKEFMSGFQQGFRIKTHGSAFAQVQTFCQGRRRMLTEKSWVVCSGQVRKSDIVCAIYGASVPFVLRPLPSGRAFELMGECYLDGFLGPKFSDDYLVLLGNFGRYFRATTSEDLPWKKTCLE